MKYNPLNIIVVLALAALLAGTAWFGYKVDVLAAEQKNLKEDYSLSNNVALGLFSVDQWRDRLGEALGRQVKGFKFTRKHQRQMQQGVEKQLRTLIGDAIAEINKPQKTLLGKLKKTAFNALVDSAEIQAQVRPFAKTIVDKVASPESQERLKYIANSRLQRLTQQTYDSTSVANYKVTQYLYKKYQVNDPVSFNTVITKQMDTVHQATVKFAMMMLGCVLLALIIWALLRKRLQLKTALLIYSLLFAFVLLAVGATAPIIEVDARIKTMQFELLGEKILFQNQVLFFQSHSVMGIIRTLIEQSKPDAVFIGVLILIFVLAFPVLRLVARGLHLLSARLEKNKVVCYLAFESDKWDMSDVMIVGLVMTYIGLNGILKSQLSGLDMKGTLTVITSNGSSLQPAFYIFTGYVLFAMLISAVLKRQAVRENK